MEFFAFVLLGLCTLAMGIGLYTIAINLPRALYAVRQGAKALSSAYTGYCQGCGTHGYQTHTHNA